MTPHRRPYPIVVCTIFFALVTLMRPAAFAGSNETKERAARLACLSGDYQRGVSLLSELFVDTSDPAHIYNQGRCLEQNRRYDDAIARFEEYLRVNKRVGKADRLDTQKHIADCQRLLHSAKTEASEDADGRGTSKDAREAKEKIAKKACLTRDVDRGVEILTDLFIETNDPTYIFNQGRCYEQGSRYEEAIERFREYLRKAKPESNADRTDAEKHIADCKAVLDTRSQSAAPRTGVAEQSHPTEPTSVPGDQPASSVEQTLGQPESGAERKSAGSGLRVGGMVAASVGVAALATGVALNLKHNSIVRDMRTNYDQGTFSSADSYKTGALIGYGIGGACIAGGALLYVLGWNAGRATVTPVANSGGVTLTMAGSF